MMWVGMVAVQIATAAAVLMFSDAGSAFAQSPQNASRTIYQDLILPLENGWQTYTNSRFGMRLSYPADVFVPSDPPAEGGGMQFTGQDALLETYGWENPGGETAETLRSRLSGTEGYKELTETKVGPSSLVLAGLRGPNVFYERYYLQGDTIQAFGMEYPVSLRETYNPIVQQIDASFAPRPAEVIVPGRREGGAEERSRGRRKNGGEGDEAGRNHDDADRIKREPAGKRERVFRYAEKGIPAGHLPPPGECRTWYADRPAGHQPPPHKC